MPFSANVDGCVRLGVITRVRSILMGSSRSFLVHLVERVKTAVICGALQSNWLPFA